MGCVLKILLVGFLVIPNLVAFVLFKQSGAESKQADFLKGATPSAYVKDGPFLAEGKLVSPGGLTVKSLYGTVPCVAYRTLVEQLVETRREDSDGNDTSHVSRTSIFEERKGVEDLVVEFAEGAAKLSLDSVETFHQTSTDEVDAPPPFVPKADVPNPGTGESWYAVSEATFAPGQAVFVAASMGMDDVLDIHPEMEQLVLFPGTREQCAEALASSSRYNKIAAIALVIASLVLSTIMAVAIKLSANRGATEG